MNWQGSGHVLFQDMYHTSICLKLLKKTTKISVRIASLWAEIWMCGLQIQSRGVNYRSHQTFMVVANLVSILGWWHSLTTHSFADILEDLAVSILKISQVGKVIKDLEVNINKHFLTFFIISFWIYWYFLLFSHVFRTWNILKFFIRYCQRFWLCGMLLHLVLSAFSCRHDFYWVSFASMDSGRRVRCSSHQIGLTHNM
jgi:hypothetical protein